MKYRRFEEVPVWSDAINLAVEVFALSSTGYLHGYGGLKNQLERAVLSISNNIAEGFERGTNQEYLTFLYIAKGSAGEVRSMLCMMERLPFLREHQAEILRLKAAGESISRQLGRWIESIKDSGFQGKRSRNTQVREAEQQAQSRGDFLEFLERVKADAVAAMRAPRNGPAPSSPADDPAPHPADSPGPPDDA